MRVLVTGCMGFIGSNVVPMMLMMGYDVIGIDNLANPSIKPTDRMKKSSGKNWDKFNFYNLDITSPSSIYSICCDKKVDFVVHLAALGSVPKSLAYPKQFNEVNINGFFSVIELSKALGAKRLIFASSSSVYGDDESAERREGREGKLLSPYAITKRANEDYARIYAAPELEYIGFRFFNVYGPGQSLNGAYSAVIPRFMTDEELTIYGDGSTIRDYTYVGDVSIAIMIALQTKNTNFICNVGAGHGVSLNELARAAYPNKKINYKEKRKGDVQSSIASTELCEKMLGFKPRTPLTDGLNRTREFYESLRGADCQTNPIVQI